MADDIRLNDLTLGSLCRIGFVLSACFWVPAGIALGIAAMTGVATVEWMGQPAPGLAGFAMGIVHGLVGALLTDAMLALGALVLCVARLRWRGPRLSLRRGRSLDTVG